MGNRAALFCACILPKIIGELPHEKHDPEAGKGRFFYASI